jgi:glycosyltransferase involved in cell wall biosynthesis
MVAFDVVVPIHNIEPWQLENCLQSISDQTHSDFTVIVVESKLSANEVTECIVAKFGYSYLVQDGKGVSQARNQGASVGSSDFIAFLDGDDKWFAEHLQVLSDEIELDDEDYVCWWGDYLISTPVVSQMTGKTMDTYIKCGNHIHFSKFRPQDWRYYSLPVPLYPSSTVVRRTAFEAIGGFNEEWLCWEDAVLYDDLARVGLGKYVESAGCWGTAQAAGTHTTKIEGANTRDDRLYWFEKLQDHAEFPSLENPPPDVSEEYWQFVVDFCCNPNSKYEQGGINFD